MSFWKKLDPRKIPGNIKRTAQKVIRKGPRNVTKLPQTIKREVKQLPDLPNELKDAVEDLVRKLLDEAKEEAIKVAAQAAKKALENYLAEVLSAIRPDGVDMGIGVSILEISFDYDLDDQRKKFLESLRRNPPTGKNDVVRIIKALGPNKVRIGFALEVQLFVSIAAVKFSSGITYDRDKAIERIRKLG